MLKCSENLGKDSGIYLIKNTVNGKVYVGKTLNFRKRFSKYNYAINHKKVKMINQRFLNSIVKYGVGKFEFSIIEKCKVDDLSDRELYWMLHYNSTDPEFGYNLRLDSSTGMVTHQLTRDKISKRVKSEYERGLRNPETTSEFFKEFWKNPDNKNKMIKNLKESKSSFFIKKSPKGDVLKIYFGIEDVVNCNGGYKWQNVYAACNGNKKSYMGFIWERVKQDLMDCSLIEQYGSETAMEKFNA